MITPEKAREIIAFNLRKILIECNSKSNAEAELILALIIKDAGRAIIMAVGEEAAEQTLAVAIEAIKKSAQTDNPYSFANLKKKGFTEAQILNAPETIQ